MKFIALTEIDPLTQIPTVRVFNRDFIKSMGALESGRTWIQFATEVDLIIVVEDINFIRKNIEPQNG